MASPVQTAATPHASNLPILVVDDEPLVLAALREVLRQAGYEVIAVANPIEALDELNRGEFSLIISDQWMPGLSGLELLTKARRLKPNTTRILITAVLSLETLIEAINKGEIYRFIVKPWIREELLAAVANGVQQYELTRQNAQLQASTRLLNQRLDQLNFSLQQQSQVAADQRRQLEMLNENLEANFLRSLELSVHTLDAFYPPLGRQTRLTMKLCAAVANIAALTPEDRRILESSARLHDIGLVASPRLLIEKWLKNPEVLDAQEKGLIRRHPIIGQELAALATGIEEVGLAVRCHHERWDGAGYPDQLQGEAIPWVGRLLAVMAAYAAIPGGAPNALDHIYSGSGTAFDPEAVRVFAKAAALVPAQTDKREVTLAELLPGMVLARGIYTRNGFLLFAPGSELNDSAIERLRAHSRSQALAESFAVYC